MKILYVILLIPILFTNSTWAANHSNKQPTLDLKSQLNLAKGLELEGKIKESLFAIEKISQNHDNNEQIALPLGRLYVKNGHINKAIKTLEPFTLEHSNDWKPWFWLGSAFLLNQDYVNAGLNIDEALAREGNNSAIWVQKALIEQARGNNQSAINILEVANNIAPNNADVLLNLAYANELTGNNLKAQQLYRTFLYLSSKLKRYSRLRAEIVYRLSSFTRQTKL